MNCFEAGVSTSVCAAATENFGKTDIHDYRPTVGTPNDHKPKGEASVELSEVHRPDGVTGGTRLNAAP